MRDFTQIPFGALDSDNDTRARVYNFPTREQQARAENDRNRRAEDIAHRHRLNMDRVLLAALTALSDKAYDVDALSAYCMLDMTDAPDVLSLILDIRAQLSPIVRDEEARVNSVQFR